MIQKPNLKLTGLFIVCGAVAFIAVAGMFVKEKFWDATHGGLVMYFEESIRGLNVGAPVVFKGVEIGKVAKIDLIANPESMSFSIPVYVRLEERQGLYMREKSGKEEILNALIQQGLRGRLVLQNYLTGQLLIELEMLPGTPVHLQHQKASGSILEIPTVLSQIGEISRGIQNLPIKESVENFNRFFAELNRQLPVVMPKITHTLEGMDKVIGDNRRGSGEMIENINRAAVSINQAAKAWRNFADYAERHPEAFLKGKQGK